MTSIEGSGFPLVFKARDGSPAPGGDSVLIDTRVRSLEGMQKEALVTMEPAGAQWRLACDEGPYLNGKDMAPFPLGFFTAGMQFCYLSQFLRGARAQGVPVDEVTLHQDNFYTMNGSFLRGDAEGGARAARLALRVKSEAEPSAIDALARMAAGSSPTQSLMQVVLDNTFSVHLNDRWVTDAGDADDPANAFEALAPGDARFLPDIIVRTRKSESVHGVDGGAGSSLKAEQKRTLHIHGSARWVEGTLMETTVDCVKPIGSSFRFLSDEEGLAPPPLAYTSAGIGFCYMTQLGRYAHIAKHPLAAYRIAQRTSFRFAGELARGTRTGTAEAVDTQVFLDADYPEEATATDLVAVGERTCFLHAAMRGEHPSQLTVELNGEPLE